MNLREMKIKPINELVEIAEGLGIEDVGRLKKQEIIFSKFMNIRFPEAACIIIYITTNIMASIFFPNLNTLIFSG